MKHDGEASIVLGGSLWFCDVDGLAKGDLGGVKRDLKIGDPICGRLVSPNSRGPDDWETAGTLWSSWRLVSSSNWRLSVSLEPSGEDVGSQSRFEGLTPGSKPSDRSSTRGF